MAEFLASVRSRITFGLTGDRFLRNFLTIHSSSHPASLVFELLKIPAREPGNMNGQASDTSARILLVEDSPAQSELLGQAIASHGLEKVTRVEHEIESALAFLENQAVTCRMGLPSLVLIDVKLTNGNGIDLVRRLRANRLLARLPIVMLTTSDDPQDIEASYAAGANGYVVKPATFSELVTLAGAVCHFWLNWNRTGDRC